MGSQASEAADIANVCPRFSDARVEWRPSYLPSYQAPTLDACNSILKPGIIQVLTPCNIPPLFLSHLADSKVPQDVSWGEGWARIYGWVPYRSSAFDVMVRRRWSYTFYAHVPWRYACSFFQAPREQGYWGRWHCKCHVRWPIAFGVLDSVLVIGSCTVLA